MKEGNDPGEPPRASVAEEVLICAVAQTRDTVDASILRSSICLEIH